MRIDAYTQVQQLYASQKPKQVKNVASAKSFSDAVQISGMGKDITVAKQAVASASDIRTDITNPIKASIANGTYDVSGDDFADRLLEKYNAYNSLLG